jgi:hypothetical protein
MGAWEGFRRGVSSALGIYEPLRGRPVFRRFPGVCAPRHRSGIPAGSLNVQRPARLQRTDPETTPTSLKENLRSDDDT